MEKLHDGSVISFLSVFSLDLRLRLLAVAIERTCGSDVNEVVLSVRIQLFPSDSFADCE